MQRMRQKGGQTRTTPNYGPQLPGLRLKRYEDKAASFYDDKHARIYTPGLSKPLPAEFLRPQGTPTGYPHRTLPMEPEGTRKRKRNDLVLRARSLRGGTTRA
jgi:hypothetical protein